MEVLKWVNRWREPGGPDKKVINVALLIISSLDNDYIWAAWIGKDYISACYC